MSEGSMKGSGIYSEDVTLEVECGECGNAWTFEKEQQEMGDPNAPDTLEELWGD